MDFKYAGYGLETTWTRIPDGLRVPPVGACRTGQKVVYCRFESGASFRLKTSGFFVSNVRSAAPFTVSLCGTSRTFLGHQALIVGGPGQEMSADFTGPVEGEFLMMPSDELQAALGADAGPYEILSSLNGPDDPIAIRPLVLAIKDCLARNEETDPFAYEAILHAVVRLLAVRTISTKRAPSLAVDQVCTLRNMILEGLGGPLSVGDLAKAMNLSEGHFARAFKVSFGESPYQYISRERTELAQSLILDENMTLEAVAARAGFSSVAQMTRAFKAHSGETSRAKRASRLLAIVVAATNDAEIGEAV